MVAQGQVQKRSSADVIVSQFGQVLVIISIVALLANYLVVGGIPGVQYFQLKVLGNATPMIQIAAAILMIRSMSTLLIRKTPPVHKTFAFFLGLIVVVGSGFLFGSSGANFTKIYYLTYNIPTYALWSLIGWSALMCVSYMLRPTKPLSMFTWLIIILGLMAVTPLGDLIHPSLTFIGNYINSTVATGGTQVMWMAAYFGIAALVGRVFLFKERLRPT